MNEFRSDLAYSHSQADQPWWREVYEAAFGRGVTMADVRADGWAQRGGVDRVLVLPSGKTLTVDEKVRRKAYNDILLERWSDVDRKTPGWVQKELACDYIAYAVETTGVCYLLPFLSLRRAWKLHGRQWVDTYPCVPAKNPGYTTVSVAVPVDVLLDALANATRVTFTTGAQRAA